MDRNVVVKVAPERPHGEYVTLTVARGTNEVPFFSVKVNTAELMNVLRRECCDHGSHAFLPGEMVSKADA